MLLGMLPDGAAGLMFWPPVECRCGRMVSMGINRMGRTLCLECDAKEPK